MIKTTLVKKSYQGWGSIKALADELHLYKAKRVLIVADPFLVSSGSVEAITSILDKENVDYLINDSVQPEPPLTLAQEMVDEAKDYAPDLVLGFGGGSAMDIAKLIAVMVQHEGAVADYLNLSGTKQLRHSGVPKIMIPTTSGTGSEVTNISVVALEATKDVVAHDFLLPDVAIVDPELTMSVPPRVTAATGVDALTHAIESYVSIHATPITEALSLQAVRLIYGALETAVHEGTNKQARIDMSYGSHLAGIAFFNAGVAGVHALAYPLGGQFHIAHGESNAVLLPYVMGYIRDACQTKLRTLYDTMGYNSERDSDKVTAEKFIEKLRMLVENVKIPPTLKDFNIEEKHLQGLAEDGLKQKRLLERSPMPLTFDDILTIYTAAYEGNYF